MIDHILGRPSLSWKRTQVFLVIFFWLWRVRRGGAEGPKLFWIRRLNRRMSMQRFTPWQIIVSFLTLMYAGTNLDSILGLGCESDAYSRSYYRATWIITGLDAGFATAMTIQPKWLRDFCSVLFSAYYILYANKADEKLRKYRAVATVEMLRITWEKTTNPYIRFFNAWDRPRVSILKKILLPRPSDSSNRRPVVGWLFFDGTEEELSQATDLILDLPGGGFICMTPLHHEERLRRWAIRCKRPVLSIDYGKAPEYPFPYAIEECFDVYRTLVYTRGGCIKMSGSKLNIIMSGDSAGGNLVVTVMYRILESLEPLPRPVALVFNYAALDFNFNSWMSPAHLRVLSHKSPLAVVNDVKAPHMRRGKSWTMALTLGNKSSVGRKPGPPTLARTRSMFKPKSNPFSTAMGEDAEEEGNVADEEDGEDEELPVEERDKPIAQRVVFTEEAQREQQQAELSEAVAEALNRERNATKAPIGTRLTMTSRTGYFQDRIISPSMMRAMAILYIGPKRNPNFQKDYYISPILGPSALLAQFPPMLMSCGEKDPFVDDTVIFAGRVREAKRMRKQELEASCRRNGRVSQNLRMTGNFSEETERISDETDEDWVRMAIIEGWSHGYMQMTTLMPEAREAIYRIGDWINDAFASHESRGRATAAARQQNGEDVDTRVIASSETETDEGLMFVPKKKRTPPSSVGRGRDPDRSSDETIIGGRTTTTTTRTPGTEREGLENPGNRVGSPASGKPSLTDVLVGTPVIAARIRTSSHRGASSSSAGKVAALVPEADLLKRRREEAVFGIGDVRAVEYPSRRDDAHR
ncbi:Alpha/Beta hydrolase protein [Gautieria morchelliformis]|nr:Alpha/Beta hydrolase protein [Gautieria morchelliformis]